MVFVTLIVWRWRKRLENKPSTSFPVTLGRTLTVGYLFWAITLVPFLLLSLSNNETVVFLCAGVLTFSLVITLRYFYYFVTIGMLGGPPNSLLRATRSITHAAPLSPLRAMAAPLAITALSMAVTLLPYPDGRSLTWNAATGAIEGIFTILATYTGLAFALRLIDDSTWRAAGLDHYRTARLDTISVRAPEWAQHLLTGKAAVKILIAAMVLFTVNISRQVSTLPAGTLTLNTVTTGNKIVRITLTVQDTEFSLRGFRPIAFSLAGESGVPVSTQIIKVYKEGESDSLATSLPASKDPVKLVIELATDRSADDLQQLEDLWLWYYSAKVTKIEGKSIQKDLSLTPPAPPTLPETKDGEPSVSSQAPAANVPGAERRENPEPSKVGENPSLQTA